LWGEWRHSFVVNGNGYATLKCTVFSLSDMNLILLFTKIDYINLRWNFLQKF
jgi:hypothetical protein